MPTSAIVAPVLHEIFILTFYFHYALCTSYLSSIVWLDILIMQLVCSHIYSLNMSHNAVSQKCPFVCIIFDLELFNSR